MRTTLLIAVSMAAFCGAAHANSVEDCVKRGVAYFKEIGSYPTLTAAPNRGRRAEVVARERCMRTTTAF
jgi:hypothetical protein